MEIRGGRGRQRRGRRLGRKICTSLGNILSVQLLKAFRVLRKHTIECKGDKLQAHVPQADIEACSSTTRPNTCEVEHSRHQRLLILSSIPSDMVMIVWIRNAVGARA